MQHIFLLFRYLCTQIKETEYGYQSIEQICLARGNHPSGKKKGRHHIKRNPKQMEGF